MSSFMSGSCERRTPVGMAKGLYFPDQEYIKLNNQKAFQDYFDQFLALFFKVKRISFEMQKHLWVVKSNSLLGSKIVKISFYILYF